MGRPWPAGAPAGRRGAAKDDSGTVFDMGVSRRLESRLRGRLHLAVRQAVVITALAALSAAVSATRATGQNAPPPAPPVSSSTSQQPPVPSSTPGKASGNPSGAAAANSGPPWTIVDPPQSTLVYGSDGSLIGEIGSQLRTSVPIASLPDYLPQAFIAIEDHRFYQHNGVDVVGVLGAIKDRVIGRRARGASTITQQLVGNMHPDAVDRRDMSLDRKLREQDAAREMERHYTKAQILEAYLNQIPFGHGWFGIDAAARHYFGKSAGELTLAEAATLAALPRSAPYYDPIRHADRARKRRDLVLRVMADQGLITPEVAAAARRTPLTTLPAAGTSPAAYFVDAVRVAATREGIPVEAGGYRIYSTLDPMLQAAADSALADVAASVELHPGYHHPTLGSHARGAADYLQGLVVALDPVTGAVRALVGGRNYADSPFDRALFAVRQPGSAFKPVVYAAAIADSIPANAMVSDTALAIPLGDGSIYRPEDADGQFLGPMTVRDALARSRNSVAVQLAMQVGIDTVIDLAHQMGITTPIAPFPSSAIGASGVHPIEMVAAYSAFATLGTVSQPQFMSRIEDRGGHTVWSAHPVAPVAVLDSNVAFIVRDMMRDVIDRGTATIVRRSLPAQIPAAGKTGTTNDNSDVWFIGCTPDLVAGVWLGFDQPQMITPGAAGGSLAAPIWARVAAAADREHEFAEWAPPATLESADLDRLTGAPADSATPPDRRYTEYFLPGTLPPALRFDPRSVFERGPVVF
jgi:penicillin-binding protein 2D